MNCERLDTAMVLFEWLSIVTGLLAAVFWFWSARVRLRWGPVGGRWRFQVIEDTLHVQGYLSAAAAVLTALSVGCHAIAQAIAQLG